MRRRPNIVLIFCDDLGYTDVGCFGATKIKTPHIDSLAHDGVRFTDFYVAQPVCSASRCGLLTGCYPSRLGIMGALNHTAKVALNPKETTIASLLKPYGYATGIFGKWHLGHTKPNLPPHYGFDEFYGLPYSNDMWPHNPNARANSYPPLRLIEGDRYTDTEVTPEEMNTLTGRYTARAVRFIEKHKDEPFLLYLPHSMPHVPLGASARFRGTSAQGLFGDVIQEIDDSVGQVLAALKKHDLERDTLVIFTSDNGPWLNYGDHAGSAEPLREGKGTCWEGGVRVPFVARWTGVIPQGTICRQPAMTIDLLPTFAEIAHANLPDVPIDGKSVLRLLRGERGATSPQDAYFFYYQNNQLQALRSGRWKLMLPHTYRTLAGRKPGSGGRSAAYADATLTAPELYDLQTDIGEKRNVAEKYPAVVTRLLAYAERARTEYGDSLTKRTGRSVRPPAQVR
jgi:arylsulfatase A-like enzyme